MVQNNTKLRTVIDNAIRDAEVGTFCVIVLELNGEANFLYNYLPDEHKAIWTKEIKQSTTFQSSVEANRYITQYLGSRALNLILVPMTWFEEEELEELEL